MMRAIERLSLGTELQEALDELRRTGKPWRSDRAAVAQIRAVLEGMCHGRTRCMYCEDNLATDIDHFWPRATFGDRTHVWSNLLLACSHCNSNAKRGMFPLGIDGRPLLLDPTDPSGGDPREHLLFLPTSGEFVPRGLRGEATVLVFGLNDDTRPRELPKGRRLALKRMVALLRDYDREVAAQDPDAAHTREALTNEPFSSVLVWLLATAAHPDARTVLPPDLCDILIRHDVATWLAP